MPDLPQAAADYYRTQQALSLIAMAAARRVWVRMGGDFDAMWARIGPELMALLNSAQAGAVTSTSAYMEAVLAELGIVAPAVGAVDVAAIAGYASDGRDLSALVYSPVVAAKQAVARGSTAAAALQLGGRLLDRIVRTQVADAGRTASAVEMLARPRVTGYVRMLNLPSCKRCVVLAGKWYKVNSGFKRHEGCDCRHVPASEDMAGDLRTDPDAAVRAGQVRGLTSGEAAAIDAGADINQVVNARRGMVGLTPAGARITKEEARILRNGALRGRAQPVTIHGQQVTITTEGTTSRGLYGQRVGELRKLAGNRYRTTSVARLTPDAIMDIAEDRDDALVILRKFGYILT